MRFGPLTARIDDPEARFDAVPGKVEVWWDRQQKVWTIQCTDILGGQIGDVDHSHFKSVAVFRAKQLRDACGYILVVGTRASG